MPMEENEYEEAIGFVPKGLKKGSAACRWMDVSIGSIQQETSIGSTSVKKTDTAATSVGVRVNDEGSVAGTTAATIDKKGRR